MLLTPVVQIPPFGAGSPVLQIAAPCPLLPPPTVLPVKVLLSHNSLVVVVNVVEESTTVSSRRIASEGASSNVDFAVISISTIDVNCTTITKSCINCAITGEAC
ncbi:MAG: hypothetical protein U7123_06020 [Potamolinea sp.]